MFSQLVSHIQAMPAVRESITPPRRRQHEIRLARTAFEAESMPVLSTSSPASGHRHALLKPSVVMRELPIPAVLSCSIDTSPSPWTVAVKSDCGAGFKVTPVLGKHCPQSVPRSKLNKLDSSATRDLPLGRRHAGCDLIIRPSSTRSDSVLAEPQLQALAETKPTVPISNRSFSLTHGPDAGRGLDPVTQATYSNTRLSGPASDARASCLNQIDNFSDLAIEKISQDKPADTADTADTAETAGTADPELCFDIEANVSSPLASFHCASGKQPTERRVYKGTSSWLRKLLQYPEPYRSALTARPPRGRPTTQKSHPSRAIVQDRLSESDWESEIQCGSSVDIARRSTTSTSPIVDRPGINDNAFREAVSNLERLLNEALSVATIVLELSHHDGENDNEAMGEAGVEQGPFCRIDSPPRTSESTLEDSSPAQSTDLERQARDVAGQTVKDPAQDEPSGPQGSNLAGSVPGYSTAPVLRLQPDNSFSLLSLQSHRQRVYEYTRNWTEALSPPVPQRISSKANLKRLPETGHQSHRKHDCGEGGFDFKTDGSDRPDRRSVRMISNMHFDASKLLKVMPRLSTTSLSLAQLQPTFAADLLSTKRGIGKGESSRATAAAPAATAATGAAPTSDARALHHMSHRMNLQGRSHISLPGAEGFSLVKSHRCKPIAKDWSKARKNFVAAVACICTALIGILIGMFDGLVPSIQYYIIDETHATLFGNVGCFLGMAIPTFFFWPLPFLHGRKPYILLGLSVAMPLLFPQAMAVVSQRLDNLVAWRAMLLVPRALMGLALGFASMNFQSILTDLFGSSLMNANPHQERVDNLDARRHGGGMGMWLGIWTWCWIGSLSVGFMLGACVINSYPPAWGFYISIMLIAVVLMLAVVSPETRRSAFRRSATEVRMGQEVSRRVARGEVMMHRVKTGPRWWGQEVWHGILLSMEMLRQPGFAVVAVYVGWIYAQVVLLIVLFGSLTSRYYGFYSPQVGLCVSVVAMGALVGIPFQKANLFSRSRFYSDNSNLMTMKRRITWTSHMVRRAIFTTCLPLMGLGYAAVSTGPPMPIAGPALFAAAVGFLSCLAVSECTGLLMETFDVSDLQPGMTGKTRAPAGMPPRRSNYSAFPRVTAGFAVMHSLALVFAAGASVLGAVAQRQMGQRAATVVVASILAVLTGLLSLVLIRFKEVQIIPRSKTFEMTSLSEPPQPEGPRRASVPQSHRSSRDSEATATAAASMSTPLGRIAEGNAAEEASELAAQDAWRPIFLGNPIGRTRRCNILELGAMTRWTDIRRRNKLIHDTGHLNRDALEAAAAALDEQAGDLRRDARQLVHRLSGRGRNLGARGRHGHRRPASLRNKPLPHHHSGSSDSRLSGISSDGSGSDAVADRDDGSEPEVVPAHRGGPAV